ncbi:hypothetical protein ACIPCD_40555, partial [Streptomyces sp. NPDC088146]
MHEIRTGSTDGARADFEKMLAQLVSATNLNVRMIAANPGDWGIDAFAGDLGGAVTVWQSKYFMPTTTTNHSQQIRESLSLFHLDQVASSRATTARTTAVIRVVLQRSF